jgi:hypothetical protein
MPTGGRALDDAPFRINVRAAPAARTRRRPQRRATVGRNHTNYVGLRSVERVEGRMTAGRAALVGGAWGIIVGALLALLAGIFPWDSGSAKMLAYGVVIGAVFGAVSGALFHEALSGGRRDFISATRIEADRYDVQVDEDAAADAKRLLAAMPSG